MDGEAILLAAVRGAPRPFRMPPLPADAQAAQAAGPDVALAFAIEQARLGRDARDLFTRSLARLVERALQDDVSFQAQVLRHTDAQVAEHVRLAALEHGDRRALRAAVDAIAHPGKLRDVAGGGLREALEGLHRLARGNEWGALREAASRLVGQPLREQALLREVLDSPSLQRLERGRALAASPVVQRYRALFEQQAPAPGGARAGATAEQATVAAFDAIAALLGEAYRAVARLRLPRGFPGDARKAKDEWDAAILRGDELVLLAEVKASPAAALSDFPRLHRGLLRLAQADADCVFPAEGGEVRVSAASLRRLAPHGYSLPGHVIYCCPAESEGSVAVLSAASKAVLLAESACVQFGQRTLRGESPSPQELLPLWDDLKTESRLRSALHQYETATLVREAMLRPRDLLEAVQASAPGA